MQITPTNTSSAATAAPSTASSAGKANSSTVSTQEFMQLLSTEMANQDPMQPMDPTQTMTQLAQFSNLQQTTTLAQTQQLATANSFLGTQVTLPGSNGNAPYTGVVTAVDASNVASGGSPLLIVNGAPAEAPVTSVTQVTYPTSTSGSASASGSTTTPSSAPSTSIKSMAINALAQIFN
jgi:flagellar basal-body rod modification protein FlgD